MEIFIDECGDLGYSQRSSRHFIVVAVAVCDPKEFRRLVKRTRSAQYRHVRDRFEFKFHSSPDRVRRAVCAGISRTTAEVSWCGMDKRLPLRSRMDDKQGMYARLSSEAMARLLRLSHPKSVHIAMDKWSNDRSVRKYLDDELLSAVGAHHVGHFPPDVRISHLDAARSEGIQVADFAAGAIYQSLERSDDSYLKMFCSRIVGGRII